jgi:hypothetical protein
MTRCGPSLATPAPVLLPRESARTAAFVGNVQLLWQSRGRSFSRPALTYAPFRSYSVIPDWSTPLSTCIFQPNICGPFPIRSTNCRSPTWITLNDPGGLRKNDSAPPRGGRYRSRPRRSLHPQQLPLVSLGPSESTCARLLAAVPRHSGIATNAPAVAIALPPITVVAIGIAQSVRVALATSGLWLGRVNFCRSPTSMLSSLCLTNSPHWRCRTRRFSMTSCFAPVRRPCSR